MYVINLLLFLNLAQWWPLLNFLAFYQACFFLDVPLQSQTKVVNSRGYISSPYIIVALEPTFPDQINIYVISICLITL